MNVVNKKVIIELKNERKYFGVVTEKDESPEYFNWIILKDKSGKEQIINDSEIVRVEVLE